MISFIIVEDNKLHMEKTKEIIIKYMVHNDYEFNLKEIPKITEKFEEDIKSDNPTVYILDFELENTNAIDVARRIRKIDWNNPIIIYTVHENMEFKVLKQRLEILDFVSKNKDPEENLFELFDICLNKFNIKKSLKFHIGKNKYNIDYSKILFIYKDTIERKSVIVTINDEYKVGLTLKKLKSMLPADFVYSHKACIINIKKALLINPSERKIVFENGVKTDLLSKTYKKELIK